MTKKDDKWRTFTQKDISEIPYSWQKWKPATDADQCVVFTLPDGKCVFFNEDCEYFSENTPKIENELEYRVIDMGFLGYPGYWQDL